MASINLGSGQGSRKALDASIPLVPFIDLLLCCVMFLLVTAVWNALAEMKVNVNQPAAGRDMPTSPSDPTRLRVFVGTEGLLVFTGSGDRTALPRVEGALDLGGLAQRLSEYRKLDPNERSATVESEDGVSYESLIATMDVVVGSGFTDIAL